ncbi:MAG: LysR family transcriptional regulator [Pseudomonadota bacterium]
MISLQDHEAVIALFEERHFGRAARRLGVTQPALTSRLRRLESEIEARLFERSRSGVEPTAAGLAFLEGARRVLDAAAETLEAVRSAQSGFGLTLRLGTTEIAAYQLVVPCLEAFRRAHPMARLRLTSGTSATLERDLEQNLIDAAFLHPPLHAPGLSERVLTRVAIARRNGHPEGEGEPPIRYPRSEAPVMMGEIDRHSPEETPPLAARAEADTAIAALTLSAAGYGPAFVPAGFPDLGLGTPAPEVPLGDMRLATSIAWRSLDRRPAVRALLRAVLEPDA